MEAYGLKNKTESTSRKSETLFPKRTKIKKKGGVGGWGADLENRHYQEDRKLQPYLGILNSHGSRSFQNSLKGLLKTWIYTRPPTQPVYTSGGKNLLLSQDFFYLSAQRPRRLCQNTNLLLFVYEPTRAFCKPQRRKHRSYFAQLNQHLKNKANPKIK